MNDQHPNSLITLIPDMNIEPGHQWLVLHNGNCNGIDGFHLAAILDDTPEAWCFVEDKIHIAHTADVDARIVKLINLLAYVRFSSPSLMQMTMEEAAK